MRERNTVFSAVAADRVMDFGLEAEGTLTVWGYEVSGQYFEVLGIQPHLGRLSGGPTTPILVPRRLR